MRDAARHLSKRAQALLLHHGMLALPQILVSLLKSSVELHLMRRQSNMLSELSQEFAVGAGKGILYAP